MSELTTEELLRRADLSPETERLYLALPRGVRITKARTFAIGATLAMTKTSTLLRLKTLVVRGFLEELPARDGTGQTRYSEWRVRE